MSVYRPKCCGSCHFSRTPPNGWKSTLLVCWMPLPMTPCFSSFVLAGSRSSIPVEISASVLSGSSHNDLHGDSFTVRMGTTTKKSVRCLQRPYTENNPSHCFADTSHGFFDTRVRTNEARFPPPPSPTPLLRHSRTVPHHCFDNRFLPRTTAKHKKKLLSAAQRRQWGPRSRLYGPPPGDILFIASISVSVCLSLPERRGPCGGSEAGWLSVCFRWCRLMMGIRVWQDSRANCSASATLERREKGGNQ